MKYPEIKERTQHLRRNPTPCEEKLWKYLRKHQLEEHKFLRQHAIIYDSIGKEHFYYVPDFYCYAEKLAIELDGEIHLQTKERDKIRDERLSGLGIRILRIRNQQLDDIDNVLVMIREMFVK